MKNRILALTAAVFLVGTAVFMDSTENKYDIDATLTRIVGAGEVVVTDARGEDWAILVDRYKPVGTKYVLHMDTNGTKSIYDDIVVGAEEKR